MLRMGRRRSADHARDAKRADEVPVSDLWHIGGGQRPWSELPLQPTGLIGRAADLANAHTRLLEEDTRLLTLTGPGGTGKTRLALATAAEAANAFRDGVYLVDLTPVREPDLVLHAIARQLQITEEVGQALESQVVAFLAGRQMLLVLDNFEQVLPAGVMLTRLLASSPHLKLLVTSREPLQVSWERTLPVAPLAVPDMLRPTLLSELAEVPSVALYVQRTQAVSPEFRLSEQNARIVAQLCARLDGLPLAIELAAARSRLLPVEEILGRLSNRLAFLTGGAREQPARHRTLRAAIEWSYDLLTTSEQVLFRQLGIFAGDWSLAAAGAVVDPPGAPTEDADAAQALFDGVASLVDKNLVRPSPKVVGDSRFGMLETIREYAFDRLQASGERPRIERRRAVFLVGLSEDVEANVFSQHQQAWLDRPERELANIRAALEWTLSEQGDAELGLRLTGALWAFWFLRGYQTEGREYLRKLFNGPRASGVPAPVRAKALFAAGFLASGQADNAVALDLHRDGLALQRAAGNQAGGALCLMGMARVHRDLGDAAAARTCAETGLSLARATGQQAIVGLLTNVLADACFYVGDLAAARTLYGDGLAIWRELGSPQGIEYSLGGLGELQRVDGRPAAARALFEEALVVGRALGDRPNIAIALGQLGLVALELGQMVEARTRFTESLLLSRDAGGRRSIALALEGLAAVAVTEGRADRAVRLAGAAHALRTVTGTRSPPGWEVDLGRRLGSARHSLGRDGWATAWLSGQGLTLVQAIAMALAEVEPRPVPDGPRRNTHGLHGNQLSPREREVAQLVAQGLTSRDMAGRLTVTERTVNTHLERIRDKLGVRSRAEITAWLMRPGVAPDQSSDRAQPIPAAGDRQIGRTTDTPREAGC